jgi:hypothetical protein
MALGGFGSWHWHHDATSAPKSPRSEPVVPSAELPTTDGGSPTDVARSRLVGAWEDQFHGKRTFTFRDDGTADMDLELEPIGALLYGPKLRFYVQWSQTGDILTLTMAGGEPPDTTKTLAKLFGETSEQRIERLDDRELHLRSLDSQKLYIHKRVTGP